MNLRYLYPKVGFAHNPIISFYKMNRIDMIGEDRKNSFYVFILYILYILLKNSHVFLFFIAVPDG